MAVPSRSRRAGFVAAVAVLVLFAAGCAGDDGDDQAAEEQAAEEFVEAPDLPSCDEVQVAVVADIDNTLTTSNDEFLQQLRDPQHVPQIRPDAPEMLQTYADLGYWVIYVTARPEPLEAHGMTGRDLTESWLRDQGFPMDDRTRVFLAPDVEAAGDAATFKGSVLEDLMDEGFEIEFAYGDAESDFDAWQVVPVPAERNFSLGEMAGHEGTTAIADEGFTDHIAEVVAPLEALCRR
ncbi:MAG: hypothetical protein JJU45_07275 [Acidimicrobiia bacterium]|nr:hypothetical protein [Acidimicrobiia bacterium]